MEKVVGTVGVGVDVVVVAIGGLVVAVKIDWASPFYFVGT